MKSSQVSQGEVGKVASLSRIDLVTEELCRYTRQLCDILAYMRQVKKIAGQSSAIDTVTPHHDLVNIFRSDSVASSGISHEALLANAPRRQEDFIEVSRVLEGKNG